MEDVSVEWPPDRRAEFAAALPKRAQKYSDDALSACHAEWGGDVCIGEVDVFVLIAIMERESGSGAYLNPRGPAGTGDGGHGRGLCQIDDRYHTNWLAKNDWRIPLVNLRKAAAILAENRDWFISAGIGEPALSTGLVCSYNADLSRVLRAIRKGRNPDDLTTGGDYGDDVLKRAAKWRAAFAGEK